MTARERRLTNALRWVVCISQAYNERGPEFCREEMRRAAVAALSEETARIDAATYRKARRETEDA